MKVLIILFFFTSIAFGKNLGVRGATFAVEEESLLKVFERNLQESNYDSFKEAWLTKVKENINRPQSLNLERATEDVTHYYTPEVYLNSPLLDEKGTIIYYAGTYVNALEKLPTYKPHWLFFNADDKAQKLWAQIEKSRYPNAKLILTGGAIKDSEEFFRFPIYFDQQGKITQKLNITKIPARVTRERNKLRIDEILIKDNGHEV